MRNLDYYIERFSNLGINQNQNAFPAETFHAAPHKPLLLLSVMDLINQGQISCNYIDLSEDLVETWNGYWTVIMPPHSRSSMAHPFPRLQRDGFWHLIANPGYKTVADYNVNSIPKLREIYCGAKLDDELFMYLLDVATRTSLTKALYQKYFVPAIHPRIIKQSSINLRAYQYSQEIMASVAESVLGYGFSLSALNIPEQKIRDQGFRKAIVKLYEHRCALCGIRILTPNGHTVVEAAHIVPWSEGHNDLPTNGLCLCRLCHWSFDEGLMGVGADFKVIVSQRVRSERNMPGHILTLAEREIFKPTEEIYWPALENFQVHRKKVFLGPVPYS